MKHEPAARGRRVPLDELMTLPENSEAFPFPQARSRQLPAGLEAAWAQWLTSQALKDMEARTMLVLRAAFQAGYEAGR